jgi:eukaryotic-like serine/threonine-protein kinase
MPATTDDGTDDRLVGGRYRLGEQLGRGGMGVVWAGRDEVLGRDVAVKEIVPPIELPAEERDMLRRRTLREARAAARISSPAAVTVYDVVEEDGRPWIVMERLAARSLADVLHDDGPLPPIRAARLGLDVLDALEAAASVGVLHRDIKPANVMVRTNGRAVLTDFGIATLEGDTTVTTSGVVLGSPAYMAPERAQGERATLASDLWSLGATLYAAVAGHSPFERTGTLPTLNAVLHDPAPVLTYTGEFGEVIDALLAKDPANRPKLDEVRARLRHIASAAAEEEETRTPESTPPNVSMPPNVNEPPPLSPPPPGPPPRTTPSPQPWEPLPSIPLPPTPPPSTPVRRTPPPPAPDAVPEPVGRSEPQTAPLPPWRPLRVALALAVVLVLVGAAGFLLYDQRSPDSEHATTEPTPAVSPSQPEAESTRSAAAPTPSTQPTATPESPGGALGGASPASLPAGFHLHTDPTGFTVGVPDGWQRSTEGPRTYFREPGRARYLLVDQTTQPKDDPLTDWQANEPSVARRLGGYERIFLDRVDYRGWNTADWEFTYAGRNDRVHVLNRNIRVSDGRAYALYWSTPERQWADSRGMFDVIAQSFQPAPG